MPNLYAALIHYPVVNKNGETIASALTNLDLHDISRATKTYGLKAFYVVTPLEDQKVLVKKIISHWTEGIGALYNPKRRSALEMIRVSDAYADVVNQIATSDGMHPVTIATCARKSPANISYHECRDMLKNGKPYVLVLGTAWGLSAEFISAADYVLEPIVGKTDYNHLSVRSAAAVIFDRLLG
ncbi:MAG: RNA methyltransferase [Desulfobacterales bacterium]|nr:RNA methyltransferase [Desulfobacterales bacterium]